MMKKCIFLLSFMIIYTLHSEPDEVLWSYSNVIFSSMPAVHPNGNVLIGDRDGDVIELNGLTGEIVRRIPINIPDSDYRIEISQDGTRLLIMGKVFDYTTLNILKSDLPQLEVKFYHPHNNKIIYNKNSYDLAIYDFELGEISSHHFPNTITAHEVSLDGRFLAIACKDYKADPFNQNTFLYFYNAQTMKSIRDLENTPSTGRVIEFLQFSETSKYVGYGQVTGGEPKATFFSCEPPYTKKEFGVHGIGFIKDNCAFLTSSGEPSFSIIWDINEEKEIYKTYNYGSYNPLYNKTYNSMIVFGGKLFALDLNNIISGVSVTDNRSIDVLEIEYINGTLNINYDFKSAILNIQVLDLKGNIILKKTLPAGVIEIALNLPIGVYILKLQDGKQEYSQKFIVAR